MTTTTSAGSFVHTLSFPELIWLRFLRGFFSTQKSLYKLPNGAHVVNRFLYDMAAENDSKRNFIISMSHDYGELKTSALPALVVEDAMGAQFLGLVMDQRRTDSTDPDRSKSRFDQVRFSYVIHCMSKNRGESRLLAATVASAIVAFRDELLASGLNKMDPLSIGTTQPLRSDSNEDFVDTPVQVTFYTVEGWHTVDVPPGTMGDVDIVFLNPESSRFFVLGADVALPSLSRFIGLGAEISLPNLMAFFAAAMEIEEPLDVSRFMNIGMSVVDPVSASSFIRMKMQISNA